MTTRMITQAHRWFMRSIWSLKCHTVNVDSQVQLLLSHRLGVPRWLRPLVGFSMASIDLQLSAFLCSFLCKVPHKEPFIRHRDRISRLNSTCVTYLSTPVDIFSTISFKISERGLLKSYIIHISLLHWSMCSFSILQFLTYLSPFLLVIWYF